MSDQRLSLMEDKLDKLSEAIVSMENGRAFCLRG